MSNNRGGTEFTMGVLVGAAFGLVVAFMFALKPGEETRDLLKEKTGEARDKGAAYLERAKDAIGEARKRAKVKFEED